MIVLVAVVDLVRLGEVVAMLVFGTTTPFNQIQGSCI